MVTTTSTTTTQWFEPCLCCGKLIEATPDESCWEVFTWCDDCEDLGFSSSIEFTSDGVLQTREQEAWWSGYCVTHHPEVRG